MSKELSFFEFQRLFPDEVACRNHFHGVRWKNGVYCPYCYAQNSYITSKGFKCRDKNCYKKFTLTTQTIFQNTKLDLKLWFGLIYLMSQNRKLTSSNQYAKFFGPMQCRVWANMVKIRKLFREDLVIELSGVVEVDEAFCSKGKLYEWGGVSMRKGPIIGLVERGGLCILAQISDRYRSTLLKYVRRHVAPGSTVYTDGWSGYRSLHKEYTHEWVNHAAREWVRGDVHTNTIENVWSLFKKNLRGAHGYVSEKHLQEYLDEAAYKFNTRNLSTMQRFDDILSRCVDGRPRTIYNLIGKTCSGEIMTPISNVISISA